MPSVANLSIVTGSFPGTDIAVPLSSTFPASIAFFKSSSLIVTVPDSSPLFSALIVYIISSLYSTIASLFKLFSLYTVIFAGFTTSYSSSSFGSVPSSIWAVFVIVVPAASSLTIALNVNVSAFSYDVPFLTSTTHVISPFAAVFVPADILSEFGTNVVPVGALSFIVTCLSSVPVFHNFIV